MAKDVRGENINELRLETTPRGMQRHTPTAVFIAAITTNTRTTELRNHYSQPGIIARVYLKVLHFTHFSQAIPTNTSKK